MSTNLQLVLGLLPESVLSLFAMLVLMVDVFASRRRFQNARMVVTVLSFVGIAATIVANAWLYSRVDLAGSAMVAVDALRIQTNMIILGASALALMVSRGYNRAHNFDFGEYYALILLCTVGMMTMVAARDLVITFLGLEIMSIGLYVLAGFDRSDRRSAEAALKYFLLGAFATGFFLYGIALIFGATGSTNLVAIRAAVATGHPSLLIQAGVALLLIGLGFKVAAVPFHMWMPDVYEGSPTPVTAFMASGVKIAAFVTIVRIFNVALGPIDAIWSQAVQLLAILTMIVGNLVALRQTNIKRMLAFSSIAHAGYLLVAVAAGGVLGVAALLFYLVSYVLTNYGAFAIVTVASGNDESRTGLADLAGFGWRNPVLGAAMTVFMLSLAGFPLTVGFIAKLSVLRAAVDVGLLPLAVVLVLASLVSYYYYLRVVVQMYLKPAQAEPVVAAQGRMVRLAIGIALVSVIGFGLLASPLMDFAKQGAASTNHSVKTAALPR